MKLNPTLYHSHTHPSHAFVNSIFPTTMLHAWGKKWKWRNEELGLECEFQRYIQNSVFSVPFLLCRMEERCLRDAQKTMTKKNLYMNVAVSGRTAKMQLLLPEFSGVPIRGASY